MRISDWSSDVCSSDLPESVAAPLSYYRNNTCKTRSLLQACVDHHIAQFVFSSTAAVYGQPDSIPVCEAAPTRPANPYGTSKLMVEWMLRDAASTHDLRYIALRSEEHTSELQSLMRISYALFCL